MGSTRDVLRRIFSQSAPQLLARFNSTSRALYYPTQMPRRRSFISRWLERLGVIVVLILIAGVILVCWMPAIVGPTDDGSAPRDGRRGSGGWRANQGQPPRNFR